MYTYTYISVKGKPRSAKVTREWPNRREGRTRTTTQTRTHSARTHTKRTEEQRRRINYSICKEARVGEERESVQYEKINIITLLDYLQSRSKLTRTGTHRRWARRMSHRGGSQAPSSTASRTTCPASCPARSTG